MQLLKDLYKIYSPSRGEKKMRKFLKAWVRLMIDDVQIKAENGNLYITKGYAETYPCVVAHLDQVQHKHGKDFEAIDCGDIIIGYSKSEHEQQGLGADDKNGIWVALKCLLEFDAIKVAFFMGEEIGCVGSEKADMSFFDDCRFVLQCDRKHGGDLITNVWGEMCSDEFLADTDFALFGYKPTHGLMTDVATLKDNGLKVSAVNISCGYYEPHTDYEFTDKEELQNCLAFVKHIITKCTKVYAHELPPRPEVDWGTFGKIQSNHWSAWDDDYLGGYDWYDEKPKANPNISKEELDWAKEVCYEYIDELFTDYPELGEATITEYAKWDYPDIPDEDIREMVREIKASHENIF